MARPPNVAIEPTNSKRLRTPVPTRSTTTAACDIWIHVSWFRIDRVCNWAHLGAVCYETMVHDQIPLVLSPLATTAVSRPAEHEIRRLDRRSVRRGRVDGLLTNSHNQWKP